MKGYVFRENDGLYKDTCYFDAPSRRSVQNSPDVGDLWFFTLRVPDA